MKTTIGNTEQLNNHFGIIRDLVKSGKVVNFEYSPVKSLKTKKQLSYIFGGVIDQLAIWNYDNTGESLPKPIIKQLLYKRILEPSIVNGFGGEQFEYLKTLSEMTPAECAEFIDKLLIFCDTLPDFVLSPDLRYNFTRHAKTEDIARVVKESEKWQERDKIYLDYIRESSCIYCGIRHNMIPHHVRAGNSAGVGFKPPDYLTLPLCQTHHQILHDTGELAFLGGIKFITDNLEFKHFCMLLYDRWINHRG